jgi:two-component system chemotaxis sensor kinase CheA
MSGTWEVKEEYRQIFLEESQDQIQEWEESLLSLEKDSKDRDQIDKMFRAIHTLKGSAGFVGFKELQGMTHDLESALQNVRDGGVELTTEMTEILFEGHDISKRMMEAFSLDEPFREDIEEFLERVRSLEKVPLEKDSVAMDDAVDPDKKSTEEKEETGKETEAAPAQVTDGVAEEAEGRGKLYRMGIKIDVEGKEAFLRSLFVQKRIEEAGQLIEINPPLNELLANGEEFKFDVVVRTTKTVEQLEKSLNLDLVSVTGISEEKAQKVGSEITGGSGTERKVKSKVWGKAKTEEVVRVPVEKLDVMMNLVGELVVQNSGFISTTGELNEKYGRTDLIIGLEEKTESLAKIARDLQDAVMKVRMLPIASVFNRFNRVVRDLAKDRHKAVELMVYGEETEIDKKVIDRIGEPLVHMVRNSVDHGIETEEERLSAGKDSIGHISLGAYQEGDHICIEVSDDGRGLDRKKIEKKAVEKGLLSRDEARQKNDEEIFSLIFLPGFSTAKKVTDISGRGVGLDVVKRAVDEMGGVVRIKSELGKGTVTTISLPLTMAIILAILVEASDALFAIPLSSVNEVIKVKSSEFHSVSQSDVIRLREEVVAVADLKNVLEDQVGTPYGSEEEEREIPIVVVSYGCKKVGIGVDKFLGNEEIVIKSLSRHYKEIEGLIGASILGNGKIALILDVEAMVSKYYRDDISGHSFTGSADIETGEYEGEEEEESVEGGAAVEGNDAGDIEFEEEEGPEGAQEVKEKGEIGESKESIEAEGFEEDKEVEIIEESEEDEIELSIEGQLKNLSEEQLEALEEINTMGAITASMSMTHLMDREIRVSFPETRVIPISKVAAELGGEEMQVGGIYVKLKGDISGGILLVMPADQLFQFSDMMYRREPGTTKEITEEEISGLTEMGNILSASFIRAMADTTKLGVNQEVPEMVIDMCLPVVDSILARFNQPGENILLTEADLYYTEGEQAVCNLLLFLDPESFEKLGEALTAGLHEEVGD